MLFRSILGGTLGMASLTAQTPGDTLPGRPITTLGVLRAAAVVDSVFVDRTLRETTVDGGDFTAYLMARLGVTVLPPDFGIRVATDDSLLHIGGRLADLPHEVRQQLSQLTLLFPPDTRIEAQVVLVRAGKDAMRFHLQGISLGGTPLPDFLVDPVFREIGRRYPALTESGRDLLVALPEGATMRLVRAGVFLKGQ